LPVFAQKVDVTATVDRTSVESGEPFTLTVSVSSSKTVSVRDPELPGIQGLDLFHSWNESNTRSTFSPGKGGFQMVVTQKFNYQMAPNKQGRIRIQPITVVVDGKEMKTKPITITSLKPGTGPQARRPPKNRPKSQDPFDQMEDMFNSLLKRPFGNMPNRGNRNAPDAAVPGEDFFIVVEVDKQQAYVGEQITAAWYLYTRGQVLDLDTLKYPDLKGFWKEDIEIATHLNFRQDVMNGIPYRKALLAKYALFPIKPGTAVVDPYKAKATIIGSGRTGFGFSRKRSSTNESKKIRVTVNELPQDSKPQNFTGGVGDFRMRAELADKMIVSGQPFEYNIRFDGEGLASRIDKPNLNLPERVKVYDQKSETRFFKTGRSYKEFKYLLIAENDGELTMPESRVSVFHPETGMYRELNSSELTINVLPGANGPTLPSQALNDGSPPSQKEEKDPLPGFIGEYQSYGEGTGAEEAVMWSSVFVFLSFVLLFKARSEMGWGVRKKTILQSVERRFKRINSEVTGGNTQQVGVLVTNAVYFVLGELSRQGGAYVELEKLLLKSPPSVRREFGEPVMKLMESFQAMGFAPKESLGELNDAKRQKQLVGKMESILLKAVQMGLKDEEEQLD
jgi:hypothetical protein